jgi:putative toxin-antitoxin system antitoxin component (TIGR02293 family)
MATSIAVLRIQNVLGGPQALGRPMATQRDLIDAVRAGLPLAALDSLTGLLGLSADTLSSALSLPKRTLARRKKQQRLTAEESDRLLRLARIAAAAVEVFGTPQKASAWLRKPNRALGDVPPLDQLDTDAGARMVEHLLGRIEHGVFS